MTRDRSIPIPPPSPPASTGILRVSGNQIVGEDGKPIILRGAGLGGHLNMENFITGYPGHEHEMRRALKAALGEERYDFFFDKV
ncbi:Endo-1,4-beta-xylanase 5 [Tulasnella sp. 408]|nr:Endo-1,4-beta-xylanase 5 [Tulasnella sp. 408]